MKSYSIVQIKTNKSLYISHYQAITKETNMANKQYNIKIINSNNSCKITQKGKTLKICSILQKEALFNQLLSNNNKLGIKEMYLQNLIPKYLHKL